MPFDIYLLMGFLLIAASIFILVFFFSKKERIKRKLKSAEVKKISHFKNGDVAKIVGEVEFVDTPLKAPLSGRPCAYYHVLIEERVSSGKSSHWKTVIKEERSGKFLVKDGDQYAYINDKQRKVHLVVDKKYTSGFMNDASQGLKDYLALHGRKAENMLGLNKSIRYKEGILENGERMSVYGRGEWKEASELNFPPKYDKILQISSAEGDAVYLSDDPATLNDKNRLKEY